MKYFRLLMTGCIFSALFCFNSTVWAGEKYSPILSYFSPTVSGVDWIFWNAEKGTPRILLNSATKPSTIFWQAESKVVYYSVGQSVYQLAYGIASAVPKLTAAMPKQFGVTHRIWLDQSNNRLRMLAMHPVANSSIKTRQGKTVFVSDQGARVPAIGLPDWGKPYIASVLEWNSRRKEWRVLTQRATKDDDGLTPGIWVFHDLWNAQKGLTNDDLLNSYTCANGECRGEVSEPMVASANKASGLQLAKEDMSLWTIAGTQASLLFGLEEGSVDHGVAHMAPPLMLLSPDRKQADLLPIGQRTQIGLGVSDSYLLVADEWGWVNPVVFDLRTGKPLLQAATGLEAVWVPVAAER